jgi:hypothetical protein
VHFLVEVEGRKLPRGGRKKKKTYICASSQKKVRTYLFFFSAFLGVSPQGEFENTRKKIEYVSKKITGEIFFSGGNCFGYHKVSRLRAKDQRQFWRKPESAKSPSGSRLGDNRRAGCLGWLAICARQIWFGLLFSLSVRQKIACGAGG